MKDNLRNKLLQKFILRDTTYCRQVSYKIWFLNYVCISRFELYIILYECCNLVEMRPPLRIRKTKKRRVVQEAGSRPSNYEPGSQFPSERQMNRYQQEQGADQQYNHYARSSTTPREAEAAQRRTYHIYSTDSPGNC